MAKVVPWARGGAGDAGNGGTGSYDHGFAKPHAAGKCQFDSWGWSAASSDNARTAQWLRVQETLDENVKLFWILSILSIEDAD